MVDWGTTYPARQTRIGFRDDDGQGCVDEQERDLMTSSDQLSEGDEVGEYVVERPVGEGSFGTVYAGVHPVIGKSAAIKVLHRKFTAQPDVVDRFVREAQAVNRIQHRNIIDIFSFGELPDGRPYLIMELLKGETLETWLQRETTVPTADALNILRGVADALDAAHAEGIAHRDLKPDNIFIAVDRDGVITPKLLDFGIAKLIDDEERAHKTATGAAIGTPYYMAPEQCGGLAVDHRADLYAFGVVVYEMLTGKLPFDGGSVVEILYEHMHGEPAPPSQVHGDVPASLDPPVMALLAKVPEDRPATVGDALAELTAAAKEAGLFDIRSERSPRATEGMRARLASTPGGLRGRPSSGGRGRGGAHASDETLLSRVDGAKTTPLPGATLQAVSSRNPEALSDTGEVDEEALGLPVPNPAGRRTTVAALVLVSIAVIVMVAAFVTRGSEDEATRGGPMGAAAAASDDGPSGDARPGLEEAPDVPASDETASGAPESAVPSATAFPSTTAPTPPAAIAPRVAAPPAGRPPAGARRPPPAPTKPTPKPATLPKPGTPAFLDDR
ncbi:MAG: serine/threonine-protein kinase [Myxococcota bacterium]